MQKTINISQLIKDLKALKDKGITSVSFNDKISQHDVNIEYLLDILIKLQAATGCERFVSNATITYKHLDSHGFTWDRILAKPR